MVGDSYRIYKGGKKPTRQTCQRSAGLAELGGSKGNLLFLADLTLLTTATSSSSRALFVMPILTGAGGAGEAGRSTTL